MKILFMGTPDIARDILQALCDNGHDILGVFTQPDKPKGRGYTLTPPPVKLYAVEHSIPVYQPKTLRDGEIIEQINKIGAELIVVVAYGKILPSEILKLPKYGCINVHASLLPEYRGAAPIQRSIMDGKTETGVTTMFMDEGLDTGDMLLAKKVKIGNDMNYLDLTNALSQSGAEILLQTIEKLENGTLKKIKQDDSAATYAAKIEKSELLVDFSKSAKEIHDLVRSVYPSLAAYSYVNTAKGRKQIKLAKTEVLDSDSDAKVGEIVECDAKSGRLVVSCGKGLLQIHELIPEGKSKMACADFIRGRAVSKGDILG